jgi:hypothetical protein
MRLGDNLERLAGKIVEGCRRNIREDVISEQILCFWTLSIVLPLSKTVLFNLKKNIISETGFCLRLQVKPTLLRPPFLRSGPNVVFWKINGMILHVDKTMDNVQKHNTRTNVPSSQTFRSHMLFQIFFRIHLLVIGLFNDAFSIAYVIKCGMILIDELKRYRRGQSCRI